MLHVRADIRQLVIHFHKPSKANVHSIGAYLSKFACISVDLLAAAKYPDPPNFCHRRKSARKITAAVNTDEFVKFGEPP